MLSTGVGGGWLGAVLHKPTTWHMYTCCYRVLHFQVFFANRACTCEIEMMSGMRARLPEKLAWLRYLPHKIGRCQRADNVPIACKE